MSRRDRASLVPLPSPAAARTGREFDFADLDRWLDLTDQAIRRVQRVLEQQADARPAA